MKTYFIQYDVKREKEINLRSIENFLSSSDADLYVLPEMCLSGYLFESREALMKEAEAVPRGETVGRMAHLSEKYHCTLIFGMAEKENDHLYNTAVLVSRGTYIGKYRKIHLTDFEKKFFERGAENPVFEVDHIKIGVQICFDLWFPEISRQQIEKGARLLCALANFGGPATYHLAQTRAAENLTPLILCNRIGHEETATMTADFLGKSSIMDSAGQRLEKAPSGFEQCSGCALSFSDQRKNVLCQDFDREIALHRENLIR